VAIFSREKDKEALKLSEDAELVEKTINGDTSAFGGLVEKYSSFVYRTVFFDLRCREDAEDISQEVFIKAYKSLASFRYDSEFSTWLFRICKNTVYDHLRKQTRTKTLSVYDMGDGEDDKEFEFADTDGEYQPEKAYISKETSRLVNDAISELSEEHRDVIILRDIEEKSYSEIADILSIEEGTVKSRLSRARASLKKKLSAKAIL
jgi:RNA polymerase sigma-70 factor (ECF subfamily)